VTGEERDRAGKEQNEFINQRLTWLGTFESLLFAADHFNTNSTVNQHLLSYLLPSIGLAFAISVLVGTSAANLALTKMGRQAFQDSRLKLLKYLMPGTAIPAIIALAWVLILIARRCHWS
jgi:hypothetical protein